MQKTTVNPNPEQEMTVNPFAQEQAAETQPQENAQTYPVEVDGDIVGLPLERTDHQPGQDYRVRQGALHPGRLGSALLGFREGLRCRHCADAGDRLQDSRILRAVRCVSVRGSGRLNSNCR